MTEYRRHKSIFKHCKSGSLYTYIAAGRHLQYCLLINISLLSLEDREPTSSVVTVSDMVASQVTFSCLSSIACCSLLHASCQAVGYNSSTSFSWIGTPNQEEKLLGIKLATPIMLHRLAAIICVEANGVGKGFIHAMTESPDTP